MFQYRHRPAMLQVFRLFLLVVCVAFSFGGFTFYAAVVVPVGGRVLDETSQGFVTQEVTQFLNIASGVTLAVLCWECLANRAGRSPVVQRIFAGLLGLFAVCLVVLVIVHPQLDALLQFEDFSVRNPQEFYRLHQVYLWSSTVQWLASLGLIWLTCLTVWRAAPLPAADDARRAPPR